MGFSEILTYIDHAASVASLISFPAALFGVGLFQLCRRWQNMTALKKTTLWIIGIVAFLAYSIDFADRLGLIKPQAQETKSVDTKLMLQFFGDNRVPIVVHSSNIRYWYALYSSSIEVKAFDAAGNEIKRPGLEGMPPYWTIFIVFEDPTKYEQAISEFSNPSAFGQAEFKVSNNYCIILTTSSQIPAGLLTIYTIGGKASN